MLWNAKDGSVDLDGARMDYVRFGTGKKNLILLPGLSDGLATVKGKALLLDEYERRYFADLLRRNGGNVSASAREAGIERAYLQRLIKRFGLRDGPAG